MFGPILWRKQFIIERQNCDKTVLNSVIGLISIALDLIQFEPFRFVSFRLNPTRIQFYSIRSAVLRRFNSVEWPLKSSNRKCFLSLFLDQRFMTVQLKRLPIIVRIEYVTFPGEIKKIASPRHSLQNKLICATNVIVILLLVGHIIS